MRDSDSGGSVQPVAAKLLRSVAEALAKPGPRRDRARAAADLIRAATAARWVGIYTVTETAVAIDAWSGPGPPAFPTFPRTRGLTAHALSAKAAALSNDVANDPRYLSNQADSGSELIVPVLRDGDVVGTLDVESAEIGAFDGAEITMYQQLADALSALWQDGPHPSRRLREDSECLPSSPRPSRTRPT